jgi:prephenate dehydrogenase
MEKNKQKNIAIIGVGLIGGSLGLALKKLKKYRIIGIGRYAHKLKYAKKFGAVDEIYVDPEKGVKNADIIVFATPVMTYSKIAEEIKPFIKKDAVVLM